MSSLHILSGGDIICFDIMDAKTVQYIKAVLILISHCKISRWLRTIFYSAKLLFGIYFITKRDKVLLYPSKILNDLTQ